MLFYILFNLFNFYTNNYFYLYFNYKSKIVNFINLDKSNTNYLV